MIRKILRLLSGCRESDESEEQMVLAGYLIPSRLCDYVGTDDVLVDEMVINLLIDVLCSMGEVSCKNKGIELMNYIRGKDFETPEIPQIRRFRMSIKDAQYYLKDVENLPLQSLLIDVR